LCDRERKAATAGLVIVALQAAMTVGRLTGDRADELPGLPAPA
jgi:hypothetical protein